MRMASAAAWGSGETPGVVEKRPLPQNGEEIDVADKIGDRVHGLVTYNTRMRGLRMGILAGLIWSRRLSTALAAGVMTIRQFRGNGSSHWFPSRLRNRSIRITTRIADWTRRGINAGPGNIGGRW